MLIPKDETGSAVAVVAGRAVVAGTTAAAVAGNGTLVTTMDSVEIPAGVPQFVVVEVVVAVVVVAAAAAAAAVADLVPTGSAAVEVFHPLAVH
jgi:hypothetical protein